MTFRPVVLEGAILAFNVTRFGKSLEEAHGRWLVIGRCMVKLADHRHLALRLCDKQPKSHPASNQADYSRRLMSMWIPAALSA